jgi:signal transduction histidine kinase
MTLALAAWTAASATIGGLSLWLGHVTTTDALPSVWRTWWLGDFSGALLVVPLVLAWSRPVDRGMWRERRLEAILAPLAVAGLSALAVSTGRPPALAHTSVSSKVLSYLVFPALIWTAVRLGQRGATLAVAVAAGFAVWATTHYTGPFYSSSLSRSVLETQLFILVASLVTLSLAAAVNEREQFAKRLWASRVRLAAAADTERRRLRRDLHDGTQQRLTALMVRLRLAAEHTEPGRAEALFQAATSELGHAIDELRDLAHGNHPAVLVERGLAAAIADLAGRSSIHTELVEVPATRLPEAVEAAAYFVVVEAVTNAQKHARASSIRLRAGISRGVLALEVTDDGVGRAVETEGSGLQGLRDRVEALGGTFNVDSRIGRGTRITATIPPAARPSTARHSPAIRSDSA